MLDEKVSSIKKSGSNVYEDSTFDHEVGLT